MALRRSAKTSRSNDKLSKNPPTPLTLESLESRVLLSAAANSAVPHVAFDNGIGIIVAQSATATSTAVTSSAATAAYGVSVTLTATVTGTAGTAPTGSVTFHDGANILGNGTLGTSDTVNGITTFTLATNSLGAGAHHVTAVYSGDATYATSTSSAFTQTATAVALTVTGITSADKVYDGTTSATGELDTSNATLVGVLSGDIGNVTLATTAAAGTFASKNVGAGQAVAISGLTISGSAAGNYTLTQPATTASITQLGVTVTGITAGNKVYDHTATATLTTTGAVLVGVLKADAATALLNKTSAAGVFPAADVGTGLTVTISGLALTGTASGNYSLTQPTATANITAKALTVANVTVSNKAYDGTTNATVNTGTAALSGVATGDTANVSLVTSGVLGVFSSKNVASAIAVTITGLTLSGANAGNYALAQPAATANITTKALTFTGITASNKQYDGTTTATIDTSGAILSGIVATDTANAVISLTHATGAFTNKAVANGVTVNITGITLSGTAATNYTVTNPTTTANITPKALTVTGITANKTYDGATSATLTYTGAALSGVITGDTVTLTTTNGAGTFASAGVASGINVTVTGLALGGAQAGNYTITQPTVSANIAKKTITVTGVAGVNRAYDGTTTGAINIGSANLVGLANVDTGNVAPDATNAHATYATKNVGSGLALTVTGLALSGSAAANYNLTQPAVTANITARPLTVTGITANNKTYTNTTAATVVTTGATLVGAITGDVVSLVKTSASGSFSSAAVGTGVTVTINNLSLSGTGAGNYTITAPTTTANITPAVLTVTGVTALTKAYDGTTTAAINTGSAQLAGILTGDTSNVSLVTGGATGTFASAAAGAGKTVNVAGLTLSGSSAGNYTLTQPTPTATISAKALTVTGITATSKVYNGSTAATVVVTNALLVGVVTADLGNVNINTSAITPTFASKNVASGITVTVAGITVSGSAAANYTVTSPTTTANITQATLTVSNVTANTKTYDSTTTATLTTTTAALVGVVSGDTVTLGKTGATGSFAAAAVGTHKNVTVSGFTISGASAGNYTLIQPTGTGNITAKALTVTGVTGVNRPYDGTTTATLNTGSPTLVGILNADTGNVTLNGSGYTATFATATFGNAKAITITGLGLSGSAAGNYTLTQPAATANVTVKALTVTNITAANKQYDGTTNVTLSTVGSALVGVAGGDTITLNKNAITGSFASKAVGNAINVNVTGLTISGAAAANYTLTEPTPTANITPKALTVTGITASNKPYDGATTATLVTTGAALVGVVTADASNATLVKTSAVGNFASTTVGTALTVTVTGLTLSGSAAGNYTITAPTTTANITAIPLTVTGITASNKVYDGTTAGAVVVTNAVLSAPLNADVNHVTLVDNNAAGAFATVNVGNAVSVTVVGLTLSGSAAGNYTITPPIATANITPKAVTVTGATFNNKVYDGGTGGTLTTSAALVSGLAPADVANVALVSTNAVSTFATTPVATGVVVTASGFTLSGSAAGNYTVTQPAGTADITTKALTVTGIDADKTYDQSTTAILNTTNAHLVGVATGDVANVTLDATNGAGTFASANAGSGIVVTVTGLALSGSAASNYTITQPAPTATIAPLALNVTGITASNKQYDGNTSATINVSGDSLSAALGGDTVTLVDGSAIGTFSTNTVANGKTVTVTGLTLSGSSAANYTISTTTATANITKKTVTVTGITANKVYDGGATATLNATNANLSGVLNADLANVTLDATNGTGTFASSDVANGISVTASGLALAGSAAANYTLTQPTFNANITPFALTVSLVTASPKVYDGTTTATIDASSGALVGVLNADLSNVTIDVTNAIGVYEDANVANNANIDVSGIALTGTSAADYSVTEPVVTANITPLALTVSNVTASAKVYDGTTVANISDGSASLNNVVNGDTVTIDTTNAIGTYANATVGAGKSVTISGITISGASAGNYTVTQPSTTANITAKALTVSGVIADKVYDTNTTATLDYTNAALVGVVTADISNVTLDHTNGAGTFASANAAPGIAVTVTGLALTGSAAANYSISQPGITATISPKPVTVTLITAANKPYDGTTAAVVDTTSATLNGVILADAANAILSTTNAIGTFSSALTGSNKTVTVTGLALTGSAAGNYAITNPTPTANITQKALTVTGITANNMVYDGDNTATVVTSGATLNGVLNADTAHVTLNDGSAIGLFADVNVAAGINVTVEGLFLTGSAAGNYMITQPNTTANITAAPLTVSGVTASDKTYDGATTAAVSTGGAQLVGIVSGDTVNLTTGGVSGTFSSASVGSGLTVTVAGLGISGASASNYTITQPTTTASINAKNLTVTGITVNDLTYDNKTVATLNTSSPTLVGVVNADIPNVSLVSSGVTANFASKTVANNINVAATGFTLSGSAASNYTLSQPLLTGNIVPRTITVSAITDQNKVYDGTTTAAINTTGAVISGVLAIDSANVGLDTSNAAGNFASANAGNGQTVAITGLALTGAAAFNYTVVGANDTGNITPAPITLTGVVADDKTYDGTNTATIDDGSAMFNGIVANDLSHVTLDDTNLAGTFASINVGSNINVTITGLALAGTAAGNYTLAQPAATASINALALTVTGITASNKAADGTTAAVIDTTNGALVGVVNADLSNVHLNATNAVGTFSQSTAGNGLTVTITGLLLSGSAAGNYTITSPNTTANIT